jgi:large subunit ribosomal protein L1
MSRVTKKAALIAKKFKVNTLYNVNEAITLLKEFASAKFNESVDISVNLGVDVRQANQVVRTSTNLPKGTGKKVRVAVFAEGDNAEKAKKAGADIVGFDDLAAQIKAGNLDFDVVIATPDAMRLVGQLGQILGPRGLMPNPKVGTVTMDVEAAVTNAKSGQVRYKTDKNGIIHCTVGKLDFKPEDLMENISALISDLKKAKPTSSKGVYLKKITLSSTMGPGFPIDIVSIPV